MQRFAQIFNYNFLCVILLSGTEKIWQILPFYYMWGAGTVMWKSQIIDEVFMKPLWWIVLNSCSKNYIDNKNIQNIYIYILKNEFLCDIGAT